jgi:hypothetical protein
MAGIVSGWRLEGGVYAVWASPLIFIVKIQTLLLVRVSVEKWLERHAECALC